MIQTKESETESERHFQTAVDQAPLILAECDADLRYRWIHNPHPDFDPATVIGRRDDELDASEGTRRLMALKRQVLASGETVREEISFPRSDGARTYDCTVRAIRNSTGAVTGVATMAVDVTDRRRAEREILRKHERNALLRGHERERKFWARELHDDFVQRLSIVTMRLSMIAGAYEIPKDAGVEIEELKQITAKLAEDLHRLSRQLHPAALEQLGLKAALRSLCGDVSAAEGIAISCVLDIPKRLSEGVDLALYRVVQEALRNVAKYARATRVHVRARVSENEIRFSIEDDGVGFDPERAHAGLGIMSMRERLDSLNGTLSIRSRPGAGTLIEGVAPLEGKAPDAG